MKLIIAIVKSIRNGERRGRRMEGRVLHRSYRSPGCVEITVTRTVYVGKMGGVRSGLLRNTGRGGSVVD